MNPLIDHIAAYLAEVVGLRMDVHPIRQENAPVFITGLYSFFSLKVGTGRFLGVMLRDPENFKPSAFEKHQRLFPPHADDGRDYKGCVLMAARLSGFVRKRLIEMKIPFIVPGVQLYWPELGMEFRSHSKNKAAPAAIDKVHPVTQVVLIGALNGCYPHTITPKELGAKFHYTAMSMTRALNEIEVIGLGKAEKSGRQRLLSFPEKPDLLWKKAKPRLNNPVRATYRFWEHDLPKDCKLLAGESALAEMSSLVSPKTATYATGRTGWEKIEKKAIQKTTIDEPGTCAVQVWRYDPALFSKKGYVDIFSLYLSMEKEKDERVEMALNEALEAQLNGNLYQPQSYSPDSAGRVR